MSRRGIQTKVDELKTRFGSLKGFELVIDRIIEEDWAEPLGPTPFPSMTSIREWDLKLLDRYKPYYMPFCDLCCLCTFGKCDLTKGNRGACGIDMAGQQSRIVLLAACIGAAAHASHARELVDHLIERFGRNHPINVGGDSILVEAPNVRTVCGIRPKTLSDLEGVMDYVERQITNALSSTHTGQEGNNLDFESKVFHVGMIDHVGMEVAELAQISTLNFPKADPEASLSALGFGNIDLTKPVILAIGHNIIPGTGILDYINANGLEGRVEVTGLCCSAHDLTRYRSGLAKIVGPISWQLRFIRTGVPDVIILDEQCVRTNLLEEAERIGAPLIVTSEKNCQGLPNRTKDDPDQVVEDLVQGRTRGVLLLHPEKVGEVAVKTALTVAPRRNKHKSLPDMDGVFNAAKQCGLCRECDRACPNLLPISSALREASSGSLEKLAELYDYCIDCGRCEYVCARHLKPLSYIQKAAENKLKKEKFTIRVGRGAISDIEIRKVGRPLVLGEIPGAIAFVGCANYANGGREVPEMVEEFLKRRYIVVASGCAAMSIGMYRNAEGKTLYEEYPGDFDAGCLTNVGSCVANSHISGALLKIASIFAKRNLRGNYIEIADYIHNRIGAVGVAWGAMSQKAASIAAGFWRLGVPVLVGPHGAKYRRMLLGRKDREEDWYVYDARTGEKVHVGPVPEHLFYVAETKEEAMVQIAKLCMRANDTTLGRAIKLTNYVDLHRRFQGTLPDDLHLLVRRVADIPITMKDEILEALKKNAWQERAIPDPTLLSELVRVKHD